MSRELEICQNCKNEFEITEEDLNFYRKISVPPPTWCPQCRFIRRYVWRNERALYKRKCSAPGHSEEMISMYAPDKNHTVYDEKYWWSDAWNPLDYGREYDFSKPFFEQYKKLLQRVPLISLSVTNNVNSPYCNVSAEDKGCYMISASGLNEDTSYSNRVANTKGSYDVYISDKNQSCYELVDCSNCFKVYFSNRANNCLESYFLYDCTNCQNCFGCVGLRSKNYHIFNKPYSKEEYERKMKEFNLGSFQSLIALQEEFDGFARNFPRRFANNINCVHTIGDNARNCKNANFCFDATGVEDGKSFTWVYMGVKDSYDVGAGSGVNVERLYECWDTNFSSSRVHFSGVIYSCYDLYYSWNCHNSHHLFGCYGLRSKEYCILNKQYSKEEYEILLPKIVEHMNTMPFEGRNKRIYRFGEFAPMEISPFTYNETIAQDYFPLTKSEAEERGYTWHDFVERNYSISLSSKKIPDTIAVVNEEIAKEIISCMHGEDKQHPFFCEASCTRAFRLIPAEIQFYKNSNLPLPRLCPNCRHYRRLSKRNTIALWNRQCMCAGNEAHGKEDAKDINYQNTAIHFHGTSPCSNEFETSYAPERLEIIYCEQYYNAEVA